MKTWFQYVPSVFQVGAGASVTENGTWILLGNQLPGLDLCLEGMYSCLTLCLWKAVVRAVFIQSDQDDQQVSSRHWDACLVEDSSWM